MALKSYIIKCSLKLVAAFKKDRIALIVDDWTLIEF